MSNFYSPTQIEPVAYIQNDFKEKFGIPRQSGKTSLRSKIVFLPKFQSAEALREIEGFSHLWLIFDFSKAREKGNEFSPTVRPPRLGGNKRVGVFASRSPFRPNFLGLSCVRLISVEQTKTDGQVLIVEGADLLDGTPIFDVKPYLPHSDCIENAIGGYADGVQDYAVQVVCDETLLSAIPKEKRQGLLECLQNDPRPSYQDDGRVYKMKFWEKEVSFSVEKGVLTVLDIQ